MNFLEKRMTKDVYNFCLKFLTKEEIILGRGTWDEFDQDKLCLIAAKNGWIELLKWVIDKGICMWGDIYRVAIKHGHFDMLKWIFYNGFPWNKHEICCYAT